ncbi:sel1 repeat family protein [Massilia endophytica]|uniref:sel1 repeat family protein n=1 Tax=Massilia endophytica TaxID=2899220 RepID=UPI001E364C84|nr:sel1 repeat family protein [Massilia endophytica]UGQ47354.1 sel1 repeat family protein [Massilia endophytica]
MKALIACLALAFSCQAIANELAEANRLLENKAYPQALALYSKLANAGNAEAQFHLGEMYWYGEAGKIDLEQARSWFGKAAAAGSKEAADALDIMQKREVRRKDIDYWVSGYQGEDLKNGRFDCARPELPPVSKDNEQIAQVEKSYAAWQACYNGFVENLNDALPPGKRIPADISRLMNQIEYDQAIAHLDKIYSTLSQQSAQAAQAVMAGYQDWRKATQAYVAARNEETKANTELTMLQLRQANAAMDAGRGMGKAKPGK